VYCLQLIAYSLQRFSSLPSALCPLPGTFELHMHHFKKNISFSPFWQNVFADEFGNRIIEIVSL